MKANTSNTDSGSAGVFEVLVARGGTGWHMVALTSQFEAWSRIWAQECSWRRRRCFLLHRHQYSSLCVQCANSGQKYVYILLHKALSDGNDSSITGLVLVKSLLILPSLLSLPAPAQHWLLLRPLISGQSFCTLTNAEAPQTDVVCETQTLMNFILATRINLSFFYKSTGSYNPKISAGCQQHRANSTQQTCSSSNWQRAPNPKESIPWWYSPAWLWCQA